VMSVSYELRKDGLTEHPAWKVTCRDAQGHALGWLVIDALTGSALMKAGFSDPPDRGLAADESQPERKPIPAVVKTRRLLPTDPHPATGRFPVEPIAEFQEKRRGEIEIRRAEPVQPRANLGQSLRRLLPF
jgi:hypothetical protein